MISNATKPQDIAKRLFSSLTIQWNVKKKNTIRIYFERIRIKIII